MRRVLLAAYAVYLLSAAYLVFWPQPDAPAGSVLRFTEALEAVGITFVTGTMVEFFFNVLLFVPLTMLGTLLWPKVNPLHWVFLGVAGTVTIEFVQYAALPDRSATLSDLVANTLGAVIGVDLGLRIRWLCGRRTSRATVGR